MSELQKEILSMIIVFDNETLTSIKPLLEKLLDEELLRIDKHANIKDMDIYDKIDTIKAVKILNSNSENISYEEVIKQLRLDGDVIWIILLNLNLMRLNFWVNRIKNRRYIPNYLFY